MQNNKSHRWWQSFFLLYSVGLLGILSLIPYLRRQIDKVVRSAEEPPNVPAPLMVVLALVQSSALLAVAVFGGLKLAPRLGLRSHLVSSVGKYSPRISAEAFGRELRSALFGAVLTSALIFLGEALFRPWTGEALERLEEEEPRSPSLTVMGVLYGGLTEELLMRWGLVSLLAELSRRVRGEGASEGQAPTGGTMWGAILLAALLFGVGHLPALAALVTLTPALVARTILLNAAGGIIFGVLFWKESLEAAMVAHGGSHVVMSLTQWVRGK